jgi:uncharacterized membrane protein YjgN (DUF898 family)
MADLVDAVAAPPPPPPLPASHRLHFHGRGSEFFPIWIVNLLLSIVTLGIYSAWAKVRTQRYFYEATELDGARFGYHGKPKAILIGRIIAFALFMPYVVLNRIEPLWGFAALGVGLCILPWLIVRAMRFRLRVTSYRNIRFSFDAAPPTTAYAYLYYLGLPIATFPTMGLITPYMQHQQFQWIVDRSRYGGTRMKFKEDVIAFYLTYLKAVGLGIAVVLGLVLVIVAGGSAIAFLGTRHNFGKAGETAGAIAAIGAITLIYPLFIAAALSFRAWLHKLMYDRIEIADIRIHAHYRVWGLIGLNLVNILMIVFTLGIAYPWVKCRTARYLLDHIEIIAPHGFDGFVAGAAESENAIGDQVTSVFDVDIGIGL